MGYKSDADQNSPQIYPTGENPKVLITDLLPTRHAARSNVIKNCLTSQNNILVECSNSLSKNFQFYFRTRDFFTQTLFLSYMTD